MVSSPIKSLYYSLVCNTVLYDTLHMVVEVQAVTISHEHKRITPTSMAV